MMGNYRPPPTFRAASNRLYDRPPSWRAGRPGRERNAHPGVDVGTQTHQVDEVTVEAGQVLGRVMEYATPLSHGTGSGGGFPRRRRARTHGGRHPAYAHPRDPP